MKRNIHMLAIAIFLFSAWSCQENKVKFGTIDLESPGSTQNLKFSQLAGNIRCIPFETLPDFILPDDNVRLWVSGKYIITISDQDIRQFSPEGKFIRKLASAGKGPDEYANLLSYTVDEQNDILYYGHQNDWENIYAINLRDGQPAGKINTGCLPISMSVMDGNILCIPLKVRTEKQLDAFLITPSGKITDSIPTPPSGEKFGFSMNKGLIPGNKEWHILKNDTVFRLDFKQIQPVATIRCDNKFNMDAGTDGNTYEILFKTKDYLLTGKQSVEMKRSEQVFSIGIHRTATFLTDVHTFKTGKLDKFYLDILDQEYSDFPDLNVSGQKIFWLASAFDIKNLAKEKREAGQTLSPALQQLDEQLTEESNPVIIVGDLN